MLQKIPAIKLCSKSIDYHISKYKIDSNSSQYKDLYQEAIIGVLHARTLYFSNLRKNKASFVTYANNWIRKYIWEAIYKMNYPYGVCGKTVFNHQKLQNDKYHTSTLTDLQIPNFNNSRQNYDDIIPMFLSRIQGKFSVQECAIIIDYYLEGLTYKELQKKYGLVNRKLLKIQGLQDIFKEIKEEWNE